MAGGFKAGEQIRARRCALEQMTEKELAQEILQENLAMGVLRVFRWAKKVVVRWPERA